VSATIVDHGLSADDAAAVQSWGRADAEAELWSLLVQAIQTQPSSRSTDQQGAVAWLTDVLRHERAQAAYQAGLEYVRWAGGTPLSALLAGSVYQNAVFPFAARVNQAAVSAVFQAGEVGGDAAGDAAVAAAEGAIDAEAIGGAVAASSVAAIAGIALVAIAIAVTEGIQVVDAAQLPGKLAALIAGAATATPDLQAALGDTNQAQGLYGLFVGATLPTPQPGTNAPALPDPATPDPYFDVGPRGVVDGVGTLGPSLSPSDLTRTASITVTDAAAGITTTARLHETWFVEQVSAPSLTTTVALQTLRLRYTDWNGVEQTAWLLRAGGRYSFLTVADQTTSSAPPNPATCIADGTCADADAILYAGPDGRDYWAQVLQAVPPVATYNAGATPTEGSPTTFDASPSSSILGLPLTYQWRFEQPATGGLHCQSNGFFNCDPYANYTAPTAPVSGTQVSYTWQRSGTYGVLLTATDSLGKVATVTGTVTVADVPPALTLSPAAPAPAASPITLTGVITHAGSLDTERVTVDWGDGSTPDANSVNDPNSLGFVLPGQAAPSPALSAISGTLLGVADTHTYAALGVYTVTVRVTDQAGATSTATGTSAWASRPSPSRRRPRTPTARRRSRSRRRAAPRATRSRSAPGPVRSARPRGRTGRQSPSSARGPARSRPARPATATTARPPPSSRAS